MLHQQLKEYTTAAHQLLEKKLISQIKSIHSARDYVRLLKMMYGYYAAIEVEIERYAAAHPNVNFSNRRKAEYLLDDLKFFNSFEQPLLCQELPAINSYPAALGALYVLEGSTLGGKIIAQMIAGKFNMTSPQGISFFLGYGEETQAMWQQFKTLLEQHFSDSEKEEVMRTANDTFTTFRNWVERQSVVASTVL